MGYRYKNNTRSATRTYIRGHDMPFFGLEKVGGPHITHMIDFSYVDSIDFWWSPSFTFDIQRIQTYSTINPFGCSLRLFVAVSITKVKPKYVKTKTGKFFFKDND